MWVSLGIFTGEGRGEVGFPGHRAIKEQEGLMPPFFRSCGFLQNGCSRALCSPRLEEACGYGTCECHDYKIGSRDKVATGGVVISGSPEVSAGDDRDTLVPCIAPRLREGDSVRYSNHMDSWDNSTRNTSYVLVGKI